MVLIEYEIKIGNSMEFRLACRGKSEAVFQTRANKKSREGEGGRTTAQQHNQITGQP
jgi:hypothetical protein